MPLEEIQKQSSVPDRKSQKKMEERLQNDSQMRLSNGFDVFECPPPKTENEVWLCGSTGGLNVRVGEGREQQVTASPNGMLHL